MASKVKVFREVCRIQIVSIRFRLSTRLVEFRSSKKVKMFTRIKFNIGGLTKLDQF